ncbi:MAG: hypothetical protein ACE5H6_04650, partial [Dehalococcoidia bacterium]
WLKTPTVGTSPRSVSICYICYLECARIARIDSTKDLTKYNPVYLYARTFVAHICQFFQQRSELAISLRAATGALKVTRVEESNWLF